MTSSILLGGTVAAQVASTSRPLLKTKTSTPSSEALVGEQAHGDTAAGTNLFNSFPLISDELRQSASSLAIFAASKLAGTSTLTAAALSTLSAFPMIEAKDDDSMIVFGSGMHGLQNFMIPDELLDAAKKSKINFYSADIQSSDHHLNIKANRLILVGHGNDNGDGTQRVEIDRSLRIDKFAKEFFSDAKILHTIGCKLAVNPKRNFKKNSLKNGQILFIHSGETNIGASSMMDIGSYLTTSPSATFPKPIPIDIISKRIVMKKESQKQKPKTFFAHLDPFPLNKTAEIAENYQDSHEQQINDLYQAISENINTQISNIPRSLSLETDSKIVGKINSELERVGFKDFTKETDFLKKETLVMDYLENYLQHLPIRKNCLPEELESVSLLLSHVNGLREKAANVVAIAAFNKEFEFLKTLIASGVDVNTPPVPNQSLPIQIAMNTDCKECYELLLKNADLNKLNSLGVAPLIMHAIERDLSYESFELLLEKGANPNAESSDGQSPLSTAMVLYANSFEVPYLDGDKYKKLTHLLIEKGADPYLSRFGETPFELANYILESSEPSGKLPNIDLASEMERIISKIKEVEQREEPATSLKTNGIKKLAPNPKGNEL